MELTIDQSREITDLIQNQYGARITPLNLQLNPITLAITSSDDENVIGTMGKEKINKWYYGTLSYNRIPVESDSFALIAMQGEDCVLAYQGEGDGNEDTREGMLFNYLSVSEVPKGINITFSGIEVISPLADFVCPADSTWGIEAINEYIKSIKEEAEGLSEQMEAQDLKCKASSEDTPIPNSACSQAEDTRAKLAKIETTLECLEDLKRVIDEAEAEREERKAEAEEEAERQAELRAEAEAIREAEDRKAKKKQEQFDIMAKLGANEGFPQYGFTCPFITAEEELKLMTSTIEQLEEVRKLMDELKAKIEQTVEERGEAAAEKMGLFNTEKTYAQQISLLEERASLIKECRILSGELPKGDDEFRRPPADGGGKVFDPDAAEPIPAEEGEGGEELPEPPPAEEEGEK
jgi:hypothetical protein